MDVRKSTARQNRYTAPVIEKQDLETLFQHKWLMTAIDEIHIARNVGLAYWSVWAAHLQSTALIGMTATPVMTKPQVRS